MSKSTLIKEDLQKLSVKQLEKFATGVEGADLELVNEVIAEKRSRLEQVLDDPNVAAEVAAGAEARAKQVALDAAKAEAKAKIIAEREAAKAAAEALKAEKLAEKLKLKEEAEKLKAEKKLEKELGKSSIGEKKEAAAIAKEIKLKERQEARERGLLEIEENRRLRAIAQAEKAEITAAKLANMTFSTKINKTQAVRECLAKGMSNADIVKETGFTNKFICDTVWRIEQMVAQQEYINKRRAEIAAEKEATAATDHTAAE